MSSTIRKLVSRSKRRFIWNGMDLDLAYITSNIIAMGLPSFGGEAFYRNSASTTIKFLSQRHEDAYRIYNLCSEKSRQYPARVFGGRVAYFPFDDHYPPPFSLLEECCTDMDDFLGTMKTGSVAAVHCKAGKGRTGTVICAYLVHCGLCRTAVEAIEYYGQRRCTNGKGLTIASQRRYIHYYSQYLAQGRSVAVRPITLAAAAVVGLGPTVRKVKIKIFTHDKRKLLSSRTVPVETVTYTLTPEEQADATAALHRRGGTGEAPAKVTVRVAAIPDLGAHPEDVVAASGDADADAALPEAAVPVACLDYCPESFETMVGDFCVVVSAVKGFSREKIAFAWLHSGFVPVADEPATWPLGPAPPAPHRGNLVIEKGYVDKLWKDKKDKVHAPDARLVLRFCPSGTPADQHRALMQGAEARAALVRGLVLSPAPGEFNEASYPLEIPAQQDPANPLRTAREIEKYPMIAPRDKVDDLPIEPCVPLPVYLAALQHPSTPVSEETRQAAAKVQAALQRARETTASHGVNHFALEQDAAGGKPKHRD